MSKKSLAAASMLAVGILSPLAAAPAQAADSSSIKEKISWCESGHSPTAQNPTSTASGKYQFLDSTWRAIPGTSAYARAKDAPVAVQDKAFDYLYGQLGTNPWKASQSCWGSKTSVPTSPAAPSASQPSAGPQINSALTDSEQTSTASTFASSASSERINLDDLKLTRAEFKAITAIEKQQAKQPQWTKQAREGKQVPRIVHAGLDAKVTTHSEAAFDAEASTDNGLREGQRLVGHYVNIDWFQIDAGPAKGQFVSAGSLTKPGQVVVNGRLPKDAVSVLPTSMQAEARTEITLSPSAAKAAIYLNAAYREQFDRDITIVNGYRPLSMQHALRAKLGSKMTANPGTSDHGLGNAFDLTNPEIKAKSGEAVTWFNENAPKFGFEIPSNSDASIYPEPWHVVFIG